MFYRVKNVSKRLINVRGQKRRRLFGSTSTVSTAIQRYTAVSVLGMQPCGSVLEHLDCLQTYNGLWLNLPLFTKSNLQF